MVPVDGSYTMAQAAMMETLKELKARFVLPMHYFGEADAVALRQRPER